ncbi:hypothetical protein [Shimia sp.]|uniref:hypothetical protein n=1 Tax=Shimia sp. TaxID=1954381 RepID=UPI003B8CE844
MICVIPSAREVRLDYLEPLIEAGCRFIVVDDSPGSIEIDHPQFSVYNHGHQDRDLGELVHAIPRRNGACRNYGFLIAWRQSDPGEIIVALDDDCLVDSHDWASAAEASLSDAVRPVVQTEKRHWNVLDLYSGIEPDAYPRGFPYSERLGYKPCDFAKPRQSKPMFNLGLWQNVFDVNAIDKLEGPEYRHPDAQLQEASVVVPNGSLVSACSMNMIFRRELIPAVYQLPMAVDVMPGWKIDRYGDIWGGFITKMLMDLKGHDYTVGGPMISHLKEGNSIRNIWQEHICHLVNDEFIGLVDGFAELDQPQNASYLELVAHFTDYLSATKGSALLDGYLQHLTRCMDAWVKAFEK